MMSVVCTQGTKKEPERSLWRVWRAREGEPITRAGLRAVAQVGSRGKAPGGRSRGEAIRPLKLKAI